MSIPQHPPTAHWSLGSMHMQTHVRSKRTGEGMLRPSITWPNRRVKSRELRAYETPSGRITPHPSPTSQRLVTSLMQIQEALHVGWEHERPPTRQPHAATTPAAVQ